MNLLTVQRVLLSHLKYSGVHSVHMTQQDPEQNWQAFDCCSVHILQMCTSPMHDSPEIQHAHSVPELWQRCQLDGHQLLHLAQDLQQQQ